MSAVGPAATVVLSIVFLYGGILMAAASPSRIICSSLRPRHRASSSGCSEELVESVLHIMSSSTAASCGDEGILRWLLFWHQVAGCRLAELRRSELMDRSETQGAWG